MFFCKYAPLFPICLSWCHLTSLSIAKNSDKFWKKVFWVWFIWSFSSLFLMAIGHTTIQCLYSFWFLIFSAVGVTAEVNCLVLYIVNTLKHKTNKLKMIFSSGFKQWNVPTILIAWHSSLIYYLFPKEEHAYFKDVELAVKKSFRRRLKLHRDVQLTEVHTLQRDIFLVCFLHTKKNHHQGKTYIWVFPWT